MNSNSGRSTLWGVVALVTLLLAAVAAFGGRAELSTGKATVLPQDVIRLESRINQLEQRLYSMDINIRGLEQQIRLSTNAPVSSRSARDPELLLLRTEVETLRQRLSEIACGLLRVDERTLTPAAREARRKTTLDNPDPCRLNVNTPLRLSAP
jgi:hypothetical protein